MIKVLFFVSTLGQGGAEKVLVNLVNQIDRNNYDVTVMTLFDIGENREFLSPHVKYRSCFSRYHKGVVTLMKLFSPEILHKWLIKDVYDIEIAYLEGIPSRIVSGCITPKTKLVSWVHTEFSNKQKAAIQYRNFEESKECYEKFDRIICVSNQVKKRFEELYGIFTPVRVCYNTVDTRGIIASANEKVTDCVFNDEEVKIVAVGKIIPNKGFDRLARIHKRLISEGVKVHTYILGMGEMKPKIEEFLSAENLKTSFTFLGYQKNPYKFLRRCDIFVCTSYREGFSTATTEALILGLPVVTVDVAGMRELLGDNQEYGIIVENNEDALYHVLLEIVKDRNKIKNLSQKAKDRAKAFSTEETVRAVEEMFYDVINGGKGEE